MEKIFFMFFTRFFIQNNNPVPESVRHKKVFKLLEESVNLGNPADSSTSDEKMEIRQISVQSPVKMC